MSAPKDLITVEELAVELRLPEGTLRSWRSRDVGPQSFRLGRRVVYRRSAVERWVARQEEATARGEAWPMEGQTI